MIGRTNASAMSALRVYRVNGSDALESIPTVSGRYCIVSSTAVRDVFAGGDEPEAVDGNVWIMTDGFSNPFNILRRGRVLITPYGAKQCISGAYTDVPLYQADGSQWNELRKMKEWLVENGAIDMTAHPCVGTHATPAINGADYNGRAALRLNTGNGIGTIEFQNITIPAWASKFVMHIADYGVLNAGTVSIGAASKSLTGSGDVVKDQEVELAVSGMRGTTVSFVNRLGGSSTHPSHYLYEAYFV